MSLNADDFGDLADVLKTIGLAHGDGSLNDDWLGAPGDYLKDVLANADQRAALLRLIEEKLEGPKEVESSGPDAGREWYPIVSADGDTATFYFVIDQAPSDHVRIGLGVRLKTTSPNSQTSFLFPLFRAGKGSTSFADPMLIGKAGGALMLSSEIELASAAPPPGTAGLRAIGLALRVPTAAGDGPPNIALNLTGLQLPGGAGPRDISLSVSDVGDLDDAVVDLILGLIEAAADEATSSQIVALAEVLGLSGSVPPLPLENIFSQGVSALADWFAGVMGTPAAKAAWLSSLAEMLGGGSVATVSGDALTLNLGTASVDLAIGTATGAAGRPVVTPSLSFGLTDGNARVEVVGDLVRLDLGTGDAVAVPSLRAQLRLGTSGSPLLTGDPSVETLRVGVELNEARKPVVILALDQAAIGSNTYPTLDLSTPDALADTATTLLSDAIGDLIGQLGPAGTSISVLLGLSAPASAPSLPTLDFAGFLSNPLGALRTHWQTLLTTHQADVPDVLAELRGLLAEASLATDAVSGSGTQADPWTINITGPLQLMVWTDGGSKVDLALGLATRQDTLGQRCTVIEAALLVSLLQADLATGEAAFAAALEARLDARARGARRSAVGTDPVRLEVDRVSFRGRWSAAEGLNFGIVAPNPSLYFREIEIPLDIPAFDQGFDALTEAQWDAIELLLGLLADSSDGVIGDLVAALGWRPETLTVESAVPARLRLADVASDPETAIRDWLVQAALNGSDTLADVLQPLARIFSGSRRSFGRIDGTGRPEDPFTLAVAPLLGGPKLAAWVEPDGPPGGISDVVSAALRDWRPGQAGLGPFELAEAVLQERAGTQGNVSVLDGRETLYLGFEALAARWSGGDGRIAVPTSLPAGMVREVIDSTAEADLRDSLDLAELFGAAPPTVIHVAVAAESDDSPFPGAPADRLLDLRPAGRAPGTFAAPAATSGTWFIALAPRADAQLASGDPDGALGQAQRLQRMFEAFAGVGGDVCVVADAAAAHAAWIAAEAAGSGAVSQIATLGMALSPVSFSILDLEPGAGVLRLLAGLLPEEDAAEPDDADLAAGRALVTALTGLGRFANPAAELSPPAALPTTVSSGLTFRAVYGRFEDTAIARAITAVVAAGYSLRAAAAAAERAVTDIDGAGVGLLLPIAPETAGITVSGHAVVELAGMDVGPPVVARSSRSLRVHLEIRRAEGWLLGGPGAGARPEHELRWVEIDAALPLTGGGSESMVVTLHDARIFDIFRDRWTLRAAGEAVAGGVVTTALPEVRVLLASLFAELAADASPKIAALRAMLRGIGVMDGSDALVAAALDRMLHEPATQVADALADSGRLADLAGAASDIFGSIPGLSFDIGAATLSFSLTGVAAEAGIPEWSLSATLSADGTTSGALSLGSVESGQVSVTTAPLSAQVNWQPPGSSAVSVPLWPSPNAADLADLAPGILISAALRFSLDYMRRLDDSAKPIIDAALDAVALLGPPDTEGERAVVAPLALLRDPAGWFTSNTVFGSSSGVDATRIIAFIDAFKPLLGVSGSPGEWAFTPGFAVRASGSSGSADVVVALDSSAFTGTAQELAFGGSIGLRIGPPTPQVLADVFVGLGGAAVGRNAAHLVVNGGVQVFLRPSAGADIPLYPNPAGLGALAQTAVTQALPLVLNEVVDGGGTPGTVTAAVGDALALREGSPASFTAARLQAWATDPAGEFESRWSSMAASAISSLASALGPAMPAGVTVTPSATGLTLTIGPVEVAFDASPFRLAVSYSDTGLPFINATSATLAFDGAGLNELTAELGPATIPAGGVDLRPIFTIAVGHGVATETVGIGLALDPGGTQHVTLQAGFDPVSFEAVFDDGSGPSSAPQDVAAGVLTLTLDLLADFLLQVDAIQDFLATPFPPSGSDTVAELLEGVVLMDGDTSQVDPGFFHFIPTGSETPDDILDDYLARLMRLIENAAEAAPTITIDGILDIGLAKSGDSVGLTVGLTDRLDLTSGDVVVSLENDSRWIAGGPPAGITLGFLDLSAATPEFAPSLSVNGVGFRIGKANAPLLDFGISLGSVALHLYGRIGDGPLAGGVQLQLSELAVGVSGASGGNPVAQGVMGETGGQDQELAPAFSPALAVQKDGAGPVMVSLSAGEGDGPWWISIRKGFGPLYVEQVGLGVTVRQEQLKKISLFFDGRISIVGLTAAVDDLQLTYALTAGPFYEPSSWSVDLAGLAVSADMSGVTLSGGLRKYVDPSKPEDVEYVGMLMARFAAYGLSIYGGYASVTVEPDGRFTAFFAYGAVIGPFGGPPAFFLTGIGGGFGINREILVPDDLGQFDDFVMIKALDPAASAPEDPLEEMDDVRNSFPSKKGQFWFAAGISFTSFAVVDGIAVVAVEFGKGFELNIFGLARMALPRPQFRLVSIELALIARFSTEDGVIWIQAQLTDNSWLLHESVRLTGGFAYVSWFGGPNKGQFVLTLGGYHPSFHRDGYPQVPRLGFHWQPISNIVVKGENYFALTSEAIMAGGGLEASATFGPAWAHVSFGANVIIYFDPFRYEADAHARISAGITIDVWIGEITISITLGARIEVQGPEFHGKVTFEVGPVELTVRFGDSSQSSPDYISWSEFVVKYLEDSGGGEARVLSSLTGKGSLPPGTKSGGDSESGTADGSPEKPYEVLSEFEMSVTTTVPTDSLKVGSNTTSLPTSMALGLPPLNASLSSSELQLSLKKVGQSNDRLDDTWPETGELKLTTTARQTGNFPAAVWGPPLDADHKKIPKGEVISATEGAHFVAAALPINRIPTEIAFNQVEAGPRKPLPFVAEATVRAEFLNAAQNLRNVLPGNPSEAEIFAFGADWMGRGGAGATALAGLARSRTAPPLLGSLGERLAQPAAEGRAGILRPAKPRPFDDRILAPRAAAVFNQPLRAEVKRLRTTVEGSARLRKQPAPTLSQMTARRDTAIPARLEVAAPLAVRSRTLIAGNRMPETMNPRSAAATVRAFGADKAARSRLDALDQMMTRRPGPVGASANVPAQDSLLPGEVAVFDMPNVRRAPRDVGSGTVRVSGGPARVFAFGLGGAPLPVEAGRGGRFVLPPRVSRIVVTSANDQKAAAPGLDGWLAEQELAFIGWSTALCAGGSVSVDGAALGRGEERARSGWIRAARFTRRGTVATRFEAFKPVLALLIDGSVDPGELDDFALGLQGARDSGAEPVVVSLGNRSALIVEIKPEKANAPGPFSLRFTSAAEQRLAGVLAADGSAEELAKALSEFGPESLIRQPLQGSGTPLHIQWTAPRRSRN